MDDYLVLVLENQKRLREVDPEIVRRKLEEQGAPGENREEELRRVLTAVEPGEETTGVKVARSTLQGLEQPAAQTLAQTAVEEATEAESRRSEEATTGEMPESQAENGRNLADEAVEAEEKAALRKIEMALSEDTLGIPQKEAETQEEKMAGNRGEDSGEASRKQVSEGFVVGEGDAPYGEGDSTARKETQKREEQETLSGAREILRRLETAERRGAGKTEPVGSRETVEPAGRGAGTGYRGKQHPDGYLRQMAQSIARREETRIIRVTEQNAGQAQTVSHQTGQMAPVYQMQWGEVDPEGLSRIFQRDARRYS